MHLPKYPSKAHASGQARIRLGARHVYLGVWGSDDSKQRYHAVLSEYIASLGQPLEKLKENKSDLSIAELVDAHRRWAEKYYHKNGSPTSEPRSFRAALRPVVRLYGTESVKDFGPLKLFACRSWLVQQGIVRTRINQHLTRIRAVFDWGVSREIVDSQVAQALKSVRGLRRGEEGVLESEPVTLVEWERVAPIQPFVTPQIWAMIRIQHLTGMRPGEVCSLRTCDILRDDQFVPAEILRSCWVYRPWTHKTEHHTKSRIVLIGPKAQGILTPWLKPDQPQEYLFVPRDAQRQFHESRRKEPSRGRSTGSSKRRGGDKYDTHAYDHAIASACERANVQPWTPNQLRHAYATRVARENGVETARILLGHSRLSTTQIYAERDLISAATVAAKQG